MKSFLILMLFFTLNYAKDLESQFKSKFENYIKELEVAGGVLTINLNNRDYTYSYGCAKLSKKAIKKSKIDYNNCSEVMSNKSRFKIGSMTKTVTANIVLKLIEDGKLSFDTKVSEILDINMSNYDLSKITIRELLNHTSELFNFTYSREWKKDYIYNPTKKYELKELFKIIDSKKSKKGYHYSNSNYIFLGKIIEKITGKSWEEVAREFLNKTLGKNSFIVTNQNNLKIENLANGYTKLDNYDKKYDTNFSSDDIIFYNRTNLDPSYSWASGCLIVNIRDINRWMKIIAEGKLYSKKFFENNVKDTTKYVKTNHFKMGYGIGYDEKLNALFHLGAIDGYSCIMMYDFDSNASISTCVNGMLLDKKPFIIREIAKDISNLIEDN